MRNHPRTYRLSFILPAVFSAVAPGGAPHRASAMETPGGRHAPGLDGCTLDLAGAPYVAIAGPSRERVFEQAARLLRVLGRELKRASGRPPVPVSIAAVVESPAAPVASHHTRAMGTLDHWSIIFGADIAFSPTPLVDPHFPPAADDSRGNVVLLADGRR